MHSIEGWWRYLDKVTVRNSNFYVAHTHDPSSQHENIFGTFDNYFFFHKNSFPHFGLDLKFPRIYSVLFERVNSSLDILELNRTEQNHSIEPKICFSVFAFTLFLLSTCIAVLVDRHSCWDFDKISQRWSGDLKRSVSAENTNTPINWESRAKGAAKIISRNVQHKC